MSRHFRWGLPVDNRNRQARWDTCPFILNHRNESHYEIFLCIKIFELNDHFNEHHGYKKDVIVDLVEWSRVNRFNPKNKWKDNIKSDIDSRWVQKDWRLTRWHCYIFLPTTIYELHLPQIPCVHNTKHNSIIIQ